LPPSPYDQGSINGKPAAGFFFGAKYGHTPGIWITNPFGKKLEGTPFSETTRQEIIRLNDEQAVVPPLVYDYSGDAISRQLDSMTLEDYLARTYGLRREAIRFFVAGEMGGGFGLGPDALSGFLQYEWFKTLPTVDDSMKPGIAMFSGGNSGMTRLIVKTLIPGAIEGPRTMEAVWRNPVNFAALDRPDQRFRIRLDSTVVRVEHLGEPSKADFASVTYSNDGRLYRIKAKTVVMAGGGWITKDVVCDLDETRRNAYEQFNYSAYMTANVAVRNWRFLYKLGISSATWFEGFGRYVNIRKSATFGVDTAEVGPYLPTVLTLSSILQARPARSHTRPARPRRNPLHFLQRLRTPYSRTAHRHVRRLRLRRQARHRRNRPQPLWARLHQSVTRLLLRSRRQTSRPRSATRWPLRLHRLSNSDLASAMDHRNAFMESHRSVSQLLDRVLT
jgi:spermidine dehydrogenase